jgi:hypothetical protein
MILMSYTLERVTEVKTGYIVNVEWLFVVVWLVLYCIQMLMVADVSGKFLKN